MTPFITIRQSSATYPVRIERGLLDRVGHLVTPRGSAFVVTSEPLRQIAARVAGSFEPAAAVIEIGDGEAAKTLETVNAIVSALLERGAMRDSMVVAVGGGVVGDTAGFAASVFMRGIDLVQVPTTLVAQLDSAIGGKVGVNHPRGKNLIGSFHPPVAVVADPDVLTSLPQRDFVSGAFEAIKGGVIADPDLFELFERRPDAVLARTPEVVDEIVRRKVRVKAGIVSADEREAGVRRLLNYGHTIGHGIEAATGFGVLSHGEAVAWGMIAANAIAVRRGVLASAEAGRIDRTIRALAPPAVRGVDPGAILDAAGFDKKNTLGRRVMVLPRRIGQCEIVLDVTLAEMEYGIAAVLSPGTA